MCKRVGNPANWLATVECGNFCIGTGMISVAPVVVLNVKDHDQAKYEQQ